MEGCGAEFEGLGPAENHDCGESIDAILRAQLISHIPRAVDRRELDEPLVIVLLGHCTWFRVLGLGFRVWGPWSLSSLDILPGLVFSIQC